MSDLTYFRVGVPRDMVADVMWNDDFEVSMEPVFLGTKPREKVVRCCANCEWWEPYEECETVTGLDDGECHRHPPNAPCVGKVNDLGIAVYETHRGSILMTHPVMYALEWCGEFHEAAIPRIEEDA